MTTVGRRRVQGFTLIEILVVIGIIGVLLALLVPALERAREQANNLKCAANLNQIGLAIVMYSDHNNGQFPRTIYDPAAPVCVGTNGAVADPLGAGGPQPNDVTAALFLLLRAKAFPALMFTEPYNDEVQDVPEPAKPLSRSNFTDYKHNLGYSYANPYPNAAAAALGFKMNNKVNAQFALAADLNPGVVGQNSRNHEKRGQNVLYADFHVQWQTKTTCGMNGDDIYTNKAGAFMASPLDPTDSVLLPLD